MKETNEARGQRLAERWLQLNGHGLPALDPVALELLTARLLGRRRSAPVVWGLGALGVLAVALLGGLELLGMSEDGTMPWSAGAGVLLGSAVLALVGAQLVSAASGAAYERRLAASLPTRVSRSATVRAADVAGRRLLVAAGLALAGCLGLVVLAWLARPGWPAVTVSGAVALATLSATASFGLALRRPTVAYDALTLALDERLRRSDVVAAVQALVGAMIVVNVARPCVMPAHGVPALLWVLTLLAIAGILLMLSSGRSWTASYDQHPPTMVPARARAAVPPEGLRP